jgi:hypothetical protein
LQESPGLSPATWSIASSGSTNPTTAPAGPGNRFFRLIRACGPGSERLDQQQPTQNSQAGSQDQWQSFTAGQSGLLTKIELWVGSPTSPAASPGLVRVYSGEGTSGLLLATEPVTFSDPLRFQAFTLSAPPQVTAGSKYTIRFGASSATAVWVSFKSADPYAGGRADLDATLDYAFKTYVEPICE